VTIQQPAKARGAPGQRRGRPYSAVR